MPRYPPPREKPVALGGIVEGEFHEVPRSGEERHGYALGVAQLGGKHPQAKHWKGEGPGVFEMVERHDGDAYRAIYTVRFEDMIYVLHAFQKKSPSGIRTAQSDIDLVHERLKRARVDYEANQQPSKQQGKGGAKK